MTSIKEIDPVDFAGGVAHVAAAQLFSFLSTTQNMEGLTAVNWFCGGSNETDDLQRSVTQFADYAVRADAGGEQLWRWGNIQGHVTQDIPDSGSFDELALPYRFAFSLFAEISKIAHRQIDQLQLEIRRAEAAKEAAANVPALKLEDSIFEEQDGLGDMEPHQAQFLKDQAALDQAATDRAAAAAAEAEQQALSAGSAGDEADDDRPEAIVLGQQQEEGHEEETADQGQEEGGEDRPDASAQGDVSDLADGDAGSVDEPAGDAPGEAAEDAAPAQDAADAAGGDGDGDVSGSVSDEAEPEKATTGKSAKRN